MWWIQGGTAMALPNHHLDPPLAAGRRKNRLSLNQLAVYVSRNRIPTFQHRQTYAGARKMQNMKLEDNVSRREMTNLDTTRTVSQWLKCTGMQGTPFSHLQCMAQSVPTPQIVIMLEKGTQSLSGAQTWMWRFPTSNFALKLLPRALIIAQ